MHLASHCVAVTRSGGLVSLFGLRVALDQSFVLDAPKFLFDFSPPSHLNFGKNSRNLGCNDVANAISNCSKSDARADGAQISRNSSIFQTFRSAKPTVSKYWPNFWRNFQRPTEHLNSEKIFAKLWSRASWQVSLFVDLTNCKRFLYCRGAVSQSGCVAACTLVR